MRQSCIVLIATSLTMALSSVRQVPADYRISLTWHELTRQTHTFAIAASDLKRSIHQRNILEPKNTWVIGKMTKKVCPITC